LRDAAGPRTAAVVSATGALLGAAERALATPASRRATDRGEVVEALLAAERDLFAVTGERTREVLAATDRDLATMRLEGAAVTATLLLALGAGLLFVVRPAARALEEATREATHGREFATSLVASAADAIYAFDADLRVTEWNPAMERWTGVSRADALGRGPGDFAAELEWGPAGRPYQRALAGETTSTAEIRGRARPGGPLQYFDVTCAPLHDAHGGVSGGVVTVRDVSERVRATAQLRASEARFSALYRQAPIGIAMHDDHGVIRDANPAFERLLGRALDELRGVRADDLSPPDDAALTREPMRELREGRRDAVQVETRFVRGCGRASPSAESTRSATARPWSACSTTSPSARRSRSG
jgi:PAS domain S-box-containing protein